MPLAQLGQTITVVNKSGKVVGTSKQLVNVWKEAKAAYLERKAELVSTRAIDLNQKQIHKAPKHITAEDESGSRTSSKASRTRRHHSKSHRHASRPLVERGYTDSFYANDNVDIGENSRPRPPVRVSTNVEHHVRGVKPEAHNRELVRRHTDGEALSPSQLARRLSNHPSQESIDMDLAYGELPPPLPARRHVEEDEVRSKMTTLQLLLEEANCVQYTATSMIEHLQKNPEALAAVALTLAEISNLTTKMAPGALLALKGSYPAIVALLMSPQFLIAAGVGVGVTVVMLGGYKVIKRIRERKDVGKEMEPLELQEIEADLSHIELWRRGIADVHDDSAGTSVDGEFITPNASQQLIAEGVLKPEDLKSSTSEKKHSKARDKDKQHRHRRSSRDDSSSRAGSDMKVGRRQKAVGGIKMLFQSHSPSMA